MFQENYNYVRSYFIFKIIFIIERQQLKDDDVIEKCI